MATLTWTGGESATTKTFMTAANWGGTAPSNDDTLIINSSSDTIGGAATGLTGITLRVGSGFTGVLGSSTTYLACTRLQSTVTIGSSASLTTVNMNGLQTGTVDIKSGVSSLATINCTSGQVLVASTCTTANALGGTITSSGTAAFTNVECDGLGSFEHLSSGTITNLEVYNGTFDHRANETAGFTLTNATVYRGGEIRGDGSLDNVTYTNGVSLQGGLATFPIGSTVTIS
jgi:hypothetical protein